MTLIVAQVSRNQQTVMRSEKTTNAMRTARDALLGYAISQPIPGVLPCPDIDGDGDADATASGCSAVAAWLPFRTLGLDNLTDASGADLWYVVDPDYTGTVTPFNSSSLSNLRVNGALAAFLILAPNLTFDGQSRMAGNLNRANYFEGSNGDADPYVYQQAQSQDNNDQLLAYALTDFWALFEKSVVLPEAVNALNTYYSACAAYPWSATFNSGGALASVTGLQQGNLPLDTSLASSGSCASTLSVPGWLRTHWGDKLQYSFCLSAQGQCLSITGDVTASATSLVIGSGVPLSGQFRPSAQLSQYFENVNQLATTQFVSRLPKNHDGSFNDVLQYLP